MNNNQLVTFALKTLGSPYWYGTFGHLANAGLLKDKTSQYPSQYTAADFESQFGKRVTDCVGIIKWAIWTNGDITKEPRKNYNAKQDVSARGMYSVSLARGNMKSFPEKEGILVYKGESTTKIHHVGIYIGNGKVIEAKGHKYGVVESKLDSSWTYWSQCPFLESESYYPACSTKFTSIVDALYSVGEYDTSLIHRKQIGAANKIENVGSYTANVKMLNLLKEGKLIKA